MKKFLFLIGLFFVSTNVFADCRADEITCPTVVCPIGTFMGDDGKCYNCDEKEEINVDCIGRKKASEICPNRKVAWACGATSKLCPQNNCPKGLFMGDDGQCYDCDEDREISVSCMKEEALAKICPDRSSIECPEGRLSYYDKCPDGYKKRNGSCCNDESSCMFIEHRCATF